MDFIHLAKGVVVQQISDPAYFSHFVTRGFTIVADSCPMGVHFRASNGLILTGPARRPMKKQQRLSCELVSCLGSDACLYLGDPRYSQGDLLVFTGFRRFPRKKRSTGLRCRTTMLP